MCRKSHITNLFWFCFGLWVNFPRYVVLWTATEDVLAGSLHSTAIVLIVFSIPDIFSKVLLSPWIIKRISFFVGFLLYSTLLVCMQLGFAFFNGVNLRLTGMCILGIVNGIGTITSTTLLGYYRESTGLYQIGENCASAFASVFYTGLTTWLCVSPRIAIAILIPFSFIPLLLYLLLDKEPLKDQKHTKILTYKPLESDDSNPQKYHQSQNEISNATSIGIIFKQLSKYFLVIYYFGVSNFLTHLALTGILPTVTFQSSPFPPRDHYQYYRFLSSLGSMIGGFEISFALFFCPSYVDTIKIRRIWIVILMNISIVMVYLTVSWFRYVENVYIIFILCFSFGVGSGVCYVHSRALASDSFTDPKQLGIVLGYMEVSLSVGRLSAALLGMFLETYLREHCAGRLMMGRFCLARHPLSSMWKTPNCEN